MLRLKRFFPVQSLAATIFVNGRRDLVITSRTIRTESFGDLPGAP
jgi:hypothetical protein